MRLQQPQMQPALVAAALSEWREQLRSAVSSVAQLADYAFYKSLPPAELASVERRFRVLVPPYYLSLIQKDDPLDPIAKMAFPTLEEESAPRGNSLKDPIGDLAKQVAPRLTHRYPDRALLHTTNLCPMYCRFCFRKNLMNERQEELYVGDFEEAFAYLEKHSEIQEIIFTGGDPWMLSDQRLSALLHELLKRAPSIRRLRFHTRMPVTLPMRVTDGLMEVLRLPVTTYVVTHFNHPRELSGAAREALAKLRKNGIVVLNQSVLLKGVNDSLDCLVSLFRGLGDAGVIPYYLHHCDLVEGAEHFRTTVEEGRELWSQLRGKLSGYLIPEYILDRPGGLGKIPLGDSPLHNSDQGHWISGEFVYADPLRFDV